MVLQSEENKGVELTVWQRIGSGAMEWGGRVRPADQGGEECSVFSSKLSVEEGEEREQKSEGKEPAIGAGVKSIKTKRLAKGSASLPKPGRLGH
jgi:hypothetical protein